MATDDEIYAEMEKRLKERRRELRQERDEKVSFYRDFVNHKLKPDLDNATDARELLYAEIAKYLELKNTLERLEHTPSTETLVNLGHEFFIEAKVPDTSKVIVEVGLGFLVEYSQKEALDFLKIKESHLEKNADKLTEVISGIKARIGLMIRGIEDLENVEHEDE